MFVAGSFLSSIISIAEIWIFICPSLYERIHTHRLNCLEGVEGVKAAIYPEMNCNYVNVIFIGIWRYLRYRFSASLLCESLKGFLGFNLIPEIKLNYLYGPLGAWKFKQDVGNYITFRITRNGIVCRLINRNQETLRQHSDALQNIIVEKNYHPPHTSRDVIILKYELIYIRWHVITSIMPSGDIIINISAQEQ